MQRGKPLKIYKASAGSGKTYTLTLNYLKLLLSDDGEGMSKSELSRGYRRILAVTFTNKATEEMKRRIVRQLFLLSSGTADSGYSAQLIAAGCAADGEELSLKSREVLYTLLHDYTNFNISTIDAFFQRTMRAFARDIGLQGGYNLEIDTKGITEEAIDRMYSSLDFGEKKTLAHWLLKYNEDVINDGNGWNSSEESIKRLSAQLFKEDYKEWRNSLGEEALPTKEEINRYNTQLRETVKSFEDELRLICSGAVKVLQGVDFAEVYKKSASPFNYFSRALKKIEPPKETFYKLPDIEDKWAQPGASAYTVEALGKIKDGDYIGRIILHFRNNYPAYVTAGKICKNLYSFGILSDIDNHIREIERERNIMLLPDTTELLNKIIDGSDTPFVYEKSGSFIKHYMIDEFQDTSRLQWKNFSPLINESISSGGQSLIVGDVKQSIYRWRNSDWRLLNGGLASGSSLRQSDIEDCGLDTNWRSAANIVEFNNRFFAKAVGMLSEGIDDESFRNEFRSAYYDVEQKLPSGKSAGDGYIDITLLSADGKDDFKDKALSRLYGDICMLLDKGVAAGDIAVLVRAKDDLRLVAEYLLKRQSGGGGTEFYIISDEALLICNSGSVRVIISMLRYILYPESKNNRLVAKYEYSLLQGYSAGDALGAALGYGSGGAEEIDAGWLERLSSMPLFEMCEEIISMLSGRDDESQIPFIQAFQDTVLNYTGRYGSNLSSFLDWWDANGSSAVISAPPGQDAVRIMTVHKSKGLEFGTVFIPFCDWSMGISPDTVIWCEPRTPGAPGWKVPVTPESSMLDSEYSDVYNQEKMLTLTDNLNIAYVAFTRAREHLIAYSQNKPVSQKQSSGVFGDFSKLLSSALSGISGAGGDMPGLSQSSGDEYMRYTLGELSVSPKESSDTGILLPAYISVPPGERLRMRLRGASYFDGTSKRKYGTLMHEILGRITTAADVGPVIKGYLSSGEITAVEGAELEQKILEQLSGPIVSEWFAPGVKVMNEIPILQPGASSLRPDRIVFSDGKVTVIDYKFGYEKNEHKKQVSGYITMIKRMGYFNVEGFLWYVDRAGVIRVE